MICTRCSGFGFINLTQVDLEVLQQFDALGDHSVILDWMAVNLIHDVSICDCCGNGHEWYGEPGHHYSNPDEPLAECV